MRPFLPINKSPDQIYEKIEKLNFLGSVLYVGAHPDDENNYLISYLSNVLYARVGYLSLNRGAGGQNILGPERRELLGVIRTEELLDARNIEDATQMFTRAADFGFSRNPKDALNHWNKKDILGDVVLAYRKFQPDVVINRFDHRIFEGTHGQHTASAILSFEAFELSNKNNEYSDQTKLFGTWQAKKLFYNFSKNGYSKVNEDVDQENSLEINLNKYLLFKGQSNIELASFSRSQHKSQGMGSAGKRPILEAFLEPLKGSFNKQLRDEKGIFDGINTTWSRLGAEGEKVGAILANVQDDFDFKSPEKSLPNLLKAYSLIKQLDNEHWKEIKLLEIKTLISNIVGLNLFANSNQQLGTLNEKITVNFEAFNHLDIPVKLNRVELDKKKFDINRKISKNDSILIEKSFLIPDDIGFTTPYWLKDDYTRSWYNVEDPKFIGLPETPAKLVATFYIDVDGVSFEYQKNLEFKTFDQRKGEIIEPFSIVPEVSLYAHDEVIMFKNPDSKVLKVDVEAFRNDISGTLHLEIPENWSVEPKEVNLELAKKNSTKTVDFKITPPTSEDSGEVSPVFTLKQDNSKIFTDRVHIIDYPHIPLQTVLLPEKTKVNRSDIHTLGKNLAYIKGAGDEVPTSLEKIGYKITFISSNNLDLDKLKQFDAVILGIRIYNVDKDVVANQAVLFDYIKQGGTLITQYSQTYNMLTDVIAPFELKSAPLERVTNENAEVEFLAPNHPCLNVPNKITEKDFDGWVQERGTYFGHEWDHKHLTPILGMHDEGHPEFKGSLLIGKYGKGYYVYTGLGFFRQLPNGNAGAFKLFANLIALGNK
jgi:LmbE family N-acetylglucosaminyl deacetylase